MRATCLLVPALVFVAGLPAQTLDRVLDELGAVRGFNRVAIAPDASRVAWVESAGGGSVIRVQKQGEPVRAVTAGGRSRREGGMAWSPDSRQIAFLSEAAGAGQSQVYVSPANGGRARKLTNLKGALAGLRWSPDGKSIAVLFTEGANRPLGPVEAVGPRTGEIEETFTNQRLAVINVASAGVRLVTPADLHVYEYDWAPDSRAFVFTAAPGPGDANWYVARIYTQALADASPKCALDPRMQVAEPRVSPDGKAVAFIGGLMSDEGSTGGDIYTLDLATGEVRDRTEGRRASPSWIAWTGPGRLTFTEDAGGGTALGTLDVATGAVQTLWSGAETIHSAGIARDGTWAVVRQSWSQPPEVWTGVPGKWRQATHANDGRKMEWGRAQDLHWKSDGFDVQGWLLYPRDFAPGRKYPLIVDVHGGPAGSRKPYWPYPGYDGSLFAAAGYFVLFPNPRGSFGQGEAFTRANVKDFGGGDLRDILAGVDEALRAAPIDPKRIGITGWSYGGFITMWAVTQTNRFRAAVAGAGLANWQSYYGENSINEWMIPYFGATVYDDPAVYAKSSPINFIKRAKTPTLVVVGERDGECPPPQSFEFWRALKTLGVKTRLVVYPGEGHAFRDSAHQRDVVNRALAWFGENLR